MTIPINEFAEILESVCYKNTTLCQLKDGDIHIGDIIWDNTQRTISFKCIMPCVVTFAGEVVVNNSVTYYDGDRNVSSGEVLGLNGNMPFLNTKDYDSLKNATFWYSDTKGITLDSICFRLPKNKTQVMIKADDIAVRG